MQEFSLEKILLEFHFKDEKKVSWIVRDAVEGVQIFGGIGSGKTSGSGKLLATKYLANGFGGLVLTAKPDEKDLWIEYCTQTNRLNDLIIIEPGSENTFNFLEYESSQKLKDTSITDNLLQVLKTVIKAGEEKDSGKSDDRFWEDSLDMLMFNTLDLCLLAYNKVTVQMLYDIVNSLPKATDKTSPDDKTHFMSALRKANENVKKLTNEWLVTLPAVEMSKLVDSPEELEYQAQLNIAEARTLGFIDAYFLETFKKLNEKTRSIIELSLSSFLLRLLKEPVYSLFCNGTSKVIPEDCLDGKIIVINLPVKKYHKSGRDCQILFKYIWQRAMEKRDVLKFPRPVFLWADEAQNFIHEHDSDFQATARSSKIATVYITQNISNYLANMGGNRSQYRVNSFLGTLATKFFHSNADIETNRYASNLYGQYETIEISKSMSGGEKSTFSHSTRPKLDQIIRPEMFSALKTGGPKYDYWVEGYFHKQGLPPFDNIKNYKIYFKQ